MYNYCQNKLLMINTEKSAQMDRWMMIEIAREKKKLADIQQKSHDKILGFFGLSGQAVWNVGNRTILFFLLSLTIKIKNEQEQLLKNT